MAPELRKRKSAPEMQKANGVASKKADKTKANTKRKAPADASPVALKKQKSTKKSTVAEKETEKPTKAAKSKKQAKTASTAEKKHEEEKSSEDEQNDNDMMLLVDELDSDEEEAADTKSEFIPGQDVGKVPAISKEVIAAAKPSTGERGVLYIGRIPHGFYEHEMRQYLSQFGPITRLRLSRNKKTGASKHFAFVEFAEESTAEIVAKTMDNYLLFGHILKVKMVPRNQAHEELFKGANRRFKKVPWNKMAGQKLSKPLTESAWEAKVEKERANRAAKAAKLKALGYEFDAPELKEVPAPAPIEEAKEEEVKAIEPAPAEKADETAVAGATKVEAEGPSAEAATISAPKAKAAKAKASKGGKAKKSKA
ncbi:hypothetical protein DCS_05427 [Drechmeria coniospora]|uniref:RRM domain-containing protein n=1 Tax=Drechmeria coniospora TaxID=98403 RepID=A0A151GN39_DRECN|nr:hypothetical protein DCS_05427 [Drechmeria coniospora]KYK58412.1 hypothetical protein DCS_05427 [Drechmeria coniospora]